MNIVRILATVLLACAATNLEAQTLALVPSADTTLFERYPGNNLGGALLAAGSTVNNYRSRALLRFPVNERLPENARVTEARLTLTVVRIPGNGPQDSVFDVFRVLRPWGEGGATSQIGASAATNEATWNERFFPASTWSIPGGEFGVDFSATPSGSILVSNETSYVITGASLVHDLQSWLAAPAANHGWVLVSRAEATAGTARRFGHREDDPLVDGYQGPLLEISFTVPAITNISFAGDAAVLAFQTESNLAYVLEHQSAPGTNLWQAVATFDPAPARAERVVTNAVGTNAQRWYRLRLP